MNGERDSVDSGQRVLYGGSKNETKRDYQLGVDKEAYQSGYRFTNVGRLLTTNSKSKR